MNYIKRVFSIRGSFVAVLILFFSLNAVAQVPVGIDPNNLSNVKIDNLTDDQIRLLIRQADGSGMTVEEGAKMAQQRGLPVAEVQKLKDRIAKIQNVPISSENNTSSSGTTSTPSEIIDEINIVKEEEEKVEMGKLENAMSGNDVNSGIFGHDFFRNGNLKVFDRSSDAKAPANYVIGVGDEIGISVFGYSYYNEVLKVDLRGYISPNQMGLIYVKGLTYDKAKSLIKAKLSQYFDFTNNKIDVNLAYSRSITVNIVGEVTQPGSYKIPAINTAFNALMLAGGPNNLGSIRTIEVRRNGVKVKTLDVYAFLFNPNSKQDFYLEENDYIIVGSIKKMVSVYGEIKRSTNFELIDGENIDDIISYAGGFTARANLKRIQIHRIETNEVKIIEVNLDSLRKVKQSFSLNNGDKIFIKSNIAEIRNRITIGGAVNYPGVYNLDKNERLLDLINKAGGLRTDANNELAFVVRVKEDRSKELIKINLNEVLKNSQSEQNLILQPLDEFSVYSHDRLIQYSDVQVLGAVKAPRIFGYVPGMTLRDVLLNAGGLSVGADRLKIEISRLSYFSNNYIQGQENKILIEKAVLGNIEDFYQSDDAKIQIQPYDQIFVRTVPGFAFQQNVTINGEVKYPGVYTLLSKDETISSVIRRAGGLTKYAFAEGATYKRPSLAGNYIVLNLKEALRSNRSKYNYVLRGGDVIEIPTITQFVSIVGSSLSYVEVTGREQVNAPYVYGRRANYYVNNFGNGFTKDSWKRKTYVVYPNTKIYKTRNLLLFNLYPKVTEGSTIYVVEKVKKEKNLTKQKEPFDWNQFVEKTMIKVSGVLTIYLLLKQL